VTEVDDEWLECELPRGDPLPGIGADDDEDGRKQSMQGALPFSRFEQATHLVGGANPRVQATGVRSVHSSNGAERPRLLLVTSALPAPPCGGVCGTGAVQEERCSGGALVTSVKRSSLGARGDVPVDGPQRSGTRCPHG